MEGEKVISIKAETAFDMVDNITFIRLIVSLAVLGNSVKTLTGISQEVISDRAVYVNVPLFADKPLLIKSLESLLGLIKEAN